MKNNAHRWLKFGVHIIYYLYFLKIKLLLCAQLSSLAPRPKIGLNFDFREKCHFLCKLFLFYFSHFLSYSFNNLHADTLGHV